MIKRLISYGIATLNKLKQTTVIKQYCDEA